MYATNVMITARISMVGRSGLHYFYVCSIVWRVQYTSTIPIVLVYVGVAVHMICVLVHIHAPIYIANLFLHVFMWMNVL